MPHRLWGSKLHERHAVDPVDTSRVKLCSATDSVEVDGAVLFEASQRLAAHSALADYRANAVLANDVGLIWFLTNAGRRASGRHFPAAVGLFRYDRPTVINDAAAQIHWRRMARQVMVDGVAPRVSQTADDNHVADLQRSNRRLVNGCAQRDLAARALEAGLVHHRDRRHRWIAIQPLLDRAR